jgi:hypothetical protein
MGAPPPGRPRGAGGWRRAAAELVWSPVRRKARPPHRTLVDQVLGLGLGPRDPPAKRSHRTAPFLIVC